MYAKAVTEAVEIYESWYYTNPERHSNDTPAKSFMWDVVNEWERFLPGNHKYSIRMTGKAIREI